MADKGICGNGAAEPDPIQTNGENRETMWLPLPGANSHAEMKALLRTECDAAAMAGSELALTPLQSGVQGGVPGIRYEYAEERPLTAAASKASVSMREFMLTALTLVDALRRLHERGVAHGALTPDRVWLHAPSGSVRFCGFAPGAALGANGVGAAADTAALGRLLAWLTHGGRARFGAAKPAAVAPAFTDGSAVPSALAALLRRIAAAGADEPAPAAAGAAQRELQRAFRRWSLAGRLDESSEPTNLSAAADTTAGAAQPRLHERGAAAHSPPCGDPGSELERLRAELNAARMRLERLEESSRRLVSNISHELRTPITLIQGYVEGILEGIIAAPDKQRRSLEMICAKATGMNRLITDLFQLTALEARQVNFELRPVAVQSLKDHLKSRFELDIEHAGHSLRVTVGKIFYDKELYVNVDLDRLDQVFTNLFTNAIRHLPKAGGRIRVLVQYLDKDPVPLLLIRVSDNGEGIAEKDLPFVFDRFYKGEAAHKERKQSGIGLGLSICQEIVASHGGAMCVTSKPGQGAEFAFTFPIAAGAPTAAEAGNNLI